MIEETSDLLFHFPKHSFSLKTVCVCSYDILGWELIKTVESHISGEYLGRVAYYEKESKDIELPFPKLFSKLADVVEAHDCFTSSEYRWKCNYELSIRV